MKRNIYSQRFPLIHERQCWTVTSLEKTSGPVQKGLMGTQGKRFLVFLGKQLLALECPLPSGLLHISRSEAKLPNVCLGFPTTTTITALPYSIAQFLLIPWAVSPGGSSCLTLMCMLLEPPVLCILQTLYSL